MAVLPQTHQGRFVELPGGRILDAALGTEVCQIAVSELHTFDAAETARIICTALNEHYGSDTTIKVSASSC